MGSFAGKRQAKVPSTSLAQSDVPLVIGRSGCRSTRIWRGRASAAVQLAGIGRVALKVAGSSKVKSLGP
jgi:hypothetical protein